MKRKAPFRDYCLNTFWFSSLCPLALLLKPSASEAGHGKERSSVHSAALAAPAEGWAQKRSQMTKIGFGDYWWQPASCWILPSTWSAVRGNSQEKGIRVTRRMHTNMLNGDPMGDKNQGGLMFSCYVGTCTLRRFGLNLNLKTFNRKITGVGGRSLLLHPRGFRGHTSELWCEPCWGYEQP